MDEQEKVLFEITKAIKQQIFNSNVELIKAELKQIEDYTSSLEAKDRKRIIDSVNYSKYFIDGILASLYTGIIIDKECYEDMSEYYKEYLLLLGSQGGIQS